MRIYKVVTTITDKTGEGAKHVQLIEAANVAAAIRHAVAGHVTCEVCSTAEAVAFGAQGVKVEKAGE